MRVNFRNNEVIYDDHTYYDVLEENKRKFFQENSI